MATTEIENPLHRLTDEQIEAIGREFDQLHDEVKADLGDRDARYIRGIIGLQRRLALAGRLLLVGSRYRPLWGLGTVTLGLAKILENMEIGHNVLHGQWDWMNDPVINSASWDWDTASTAEAWKHSHNYIHHTYTNIRGKDKDLGYEIMRIDPHQKWHPVYLLQPIYNVLLMLAFEYGVAFHEPFDRTLLADLAANVIRNLWAHSIIFCGHFPDQTYSFSQEETEDETPGERYVRQLIGAANIEGGPLFHVISGNLGYQVEHHLYPDMPSTRYGEIAPRVREICKRYELPYNTGPLHKQLGMVHRTIIRLAFPGGKPRPKPGPYRGETVLTEGEHDVPELEK